MVSMEVDSVSNVSGDFTAEHISVLGEVLIEQISLPANALIADVTIGHGGHSFLLGGILGPEGMIIGLDVDKSCIAKARARLSSLECKTIFANENFASLADITAKERIGKLDLILADLGFCSGQLSDVSRGLSFQENMPLDMRLDDGLMTTAADIVNNTEECELADLIYNFGQDRASRRIARYIVEHRRNQKITTTVQLAGIVCKALNQPARSRKNRIHPATKTFQALRIAVNNELGNLERLLKSSPDLLRKDGYIAIISFHSLEDGIVKRHFNKNAREGVYEIVTKKPLIASKSEIAMNPRSRSAKLRIAKRK